MSNKIKTSNAICETCTRDPFIYCEDCPDYARWKEFNADRLEEGSDATLVT